MFTLEEKEQDEREITYNESSLDLTTLELVSEEITEQVGKIQIKEIVYRVRDEGKK